MTPNASRMHAEGLLSAAWLVEAKPRATATVCGQVATSTNAGIDTLRYCNLIPGHSGNHNYV